MAILIACEESGIVCDAFLSKGVDAFSCDILSTSGAHPERHIKDHVECVLTKYWDAIIAFPPCTHLCVSGSRWFAEKIKDGRQQSAIDFFLMLAGQQSQFIAIENPIGVMSTKYRKPDQIIQPWQFGHGETKATCLWLKNLPLLEPTNIVSGREPKVWKMSPGPERSKLRSRTYHGIADAMASQWIPIIYSND